MGLLSLHHLWIHQSISLLMIKFYQNHLEEKSQIVQALNNAQNWLRKITKIELKKWIKNLPLDVILQNNILRLNFLREIVYLFYLP